MQVRGARNVWKIAASVATAVLVAGSAAAVPQYSPGADDRINNFLEAPFQGTNYASTSQGVGYSATTGEATVSGTVSTLNYHDVGAPAVNIAQNFSPALTFALEIELVAISLSPNQFNPLNVDVLFDYQTTSDGQWDLVVSDPSFGQVLRANLGAGGTIDAGAVSFEAPTGLRATAANVDPNAPNPLQNLTAIGVFEIDPTSLYAPLFLDSDNLVGFSIGSVLQIDAGNPATTSDWVDLFNALDCSGAPACAPSSLISHTANAQGQVFGIASGDFTPIPEPGTVSLVGAGLIAFGGWRRRRGRGKNLGEVDARA